MLGVGVALDLQAYHRLLPYQPGWAALPLGAARAGRAHAGDARRRRGCAGLAGSRALRRRLDCLRRCSGTRASRSCASSYTEDGGELGRLGIASAVAIGVTLAGCGSTAYALRPPVVHLAAGVHRGPLVITRREVLVGEPGAVVRGGIVVRARGVTIKNVSIVGGENGITIDGYRDTVLDGVSVSGAKLDGIHVRLAGVVIKNCTVDMLGNPLGQGIDISYNMDMGMSMVEGCTVIGGMEGITTHSSMTQVMDNHVSRTTMRGISVTEMSMGMVMDNDVQDSRGIGIWCNDRSMCSIEHNTVVDTSGTGFGVLASFQSEADLRGNQLGANPVPFRAIVDSEVATTH